MSSEKDFGGGLKINLMRKLISLFALLFSIFSLNAQELNCLVTINSDQVAG